VTKEERIRLPRPRSIPAWDWSACAAVLQGTHDNYEIDLFRALIGFERGGSPASSRRASAKASHRVIADHLRPRPS
jgi:alanyl-tRNA synthetase